MLVLFSTTASLQLPPPKTTNVMKVIAGHSKKVILHYACVMILYCEVVLQHQIDCIGLQLIGSTGTTSFFIIRMVFAVVILNCSLFNVIPMFVIQSSSGNGREVKLANFEIVLKLTFGEHPAKYTNYSLANCTI